MLAGIISITLLLFPGEAKTTVAGGEHSANVAGRRIFAANCASCHGLDGLGTQRAPNIAKNSPVEKLTDKELFELLARGVPSAGMPSFRSLGSKGIDAVAAYLRRLQGKSAVANLPGDAERGKTAFFGKGECANCHMADGRGGFIAPDLTTFAQARSIEQTRAAITNPAEREESQSFVTAVTAQGERYEGLVRNEDNFSLQLQSLDGGFHFLSKSRLKSMERSPSIMPADYLSRLSAAELDDLVSYLQTLADAAPRGEPRHRRRE